jgi:plastocyanin
MPFARIAAVLLAALPFAACGGDEPTARARDGTVRIVLDDFSIRPQTVRAQAGELTFDVVNRGRAGHNFHLRRGEGSPVEMTTLLPGDAESATATVRRGDYRMVCTVANHQELGMYGTLVVR